MYSIVNLYSDKPNEIKRFLDAFFEKNCILENDLKWEKEFKNPLEISDIIATVIDNNDRFKINLWISLDKDFFINVTDYNADKIIRYLFERYPY